MTFPNFFSEYKDYFTKIQRFVGRRIFVLGAITLFMAILEGVGISMLLPLLEAGDIGSGGAKGDPTFFVRLFEFTGIPFTISGVLLAMGLIFLLKGVVKYWEGSYKAGLTKDLIYTLKTRLVQLYGQIDLSFFYKQNTGHYINVVNTQVNRATQFFINFSQFSARALLGITYLVIACFLEWQFTLMALVLGGGVIFMLRYLARFNRRLSYLTSREAGNLNKFLVQTLQALRYLIATDRFRNVEHSARKSIGKLSHYKFLSMRANAMVAAFKEPVTILFMIGIILIQVMAFDRPIQPIIVTLILFYRAMNTMILAQMEWQKLVGMSGGLEMVVNEFSVVQANQEVHGQEKVPRLQTGIVLQDVSYAYDEGRNVLSHIDLEVPRNRTIALVGESGAGKSTLVDLLTLLIKPDSGELYLDGKPYYTIDQRSWRGSIGFVTQDIVVFDDTIANNISLWDQSKKEKEIRQQVEKAARLAYCEAFIQTMPQGLDTPIGEKGVRLSGGQKQRLAIARELYKEPDLLILDEATSALDSASEKLVQRSIDELKGKLTVIIIAHRLSTIKNVDDIIVLEKGKVREKGSYQDLMGKDTIFRKMTQLQQL